MISCSVHQHIQVALSWFDVWGATLQASEKGHHLASYLEKAADIECDL